MIRIKTERKHLRFLRQEIRKYDIGSPEYTRLKSLIGLSEDVINDYEKIESKIQPKKVKNEL